MRRISSSGTYFHKKVLPCILLAILVIWGSFGVAAVAAGKIPIMLLPIIVLNMLIFTGCVVFLMRKFVWPLADEVSLNHEGLLIRRGSEEDRIAISSILNVDSSTLMNPERITLTFREPYSFGSEISFIPTHRFFPFTRHPIAKELIELAHPSVKL